VHAVLSVAPEPLHLVDIAKPLHGLSRNRITVALKLLRDGGIATTNRSRAWSLDPCAKAGLDRLRELARAYEDKAERDREALERMVFYAQTGFCRWRVLLEYFDEPLMEGERCGNCDNCLRPVPVAEAESVEMPTPVAPFKSGD